MDYDSFFEVHPQDIKKTYSLVLPAEYWSDQDGNEQPSAGRFSSRLAANTHGIGLQGAELPSVGSGVGCGVSLSELKVARTVILPQKPIPAQTSRESFAELGVASRAAKSARADGSWQRYI